MVSRKLLTSALIGVFAFASNGFSAEEEKVEATKVAPMTSVLPNFYSLIQLRHYTNVALTDNSTEGTNVFAEGRYYLGSTFMDGKLDANVALRLRKETQTNTLKQQSTYIWLAYSALKTDNFDISPYADIRLPINGSGTTANLGVYSEVGQKIATAAGVIKIGAAADTQGQFSSRTKNTEVTGLTDSDKDKFKGFLVGEENSEVPTDAAPILAEYNVHVIVSDIAKVKGLSAGLTSYVDRKFEAKMEPTVIDGEERIAMTGYSASNNAYNLYTLGYKFDNGVSIANETYQWFDGVFASRINGDNAASNPRWTNLVKVSTSL
ncbi:MAG: hypothetical protein R3B45_14035 [Bdellovibrionota bacterium]